MRIPLKNFIIVFFSGILFFIACSGEKENSANNPGQASNTQNANQEIAGDDPVELGKLINLNNEPNEITYKEVSLNTQKSENRLPSPNGKKLVAVLKFSPEETEKIIEKANGYREPVSVKIDAENWFPAELIAQSQNAGDETLKGKAYAATDFLKTPYTDGKLIRIENTDYLILELVAF